MVVSSMTRPSTWLNIGVCVMSESQRKVRPGAMMRMGGLDVSMVRICTGLVCVRSSMREPSGFSLK